MISAEKCGELLSITVQIFDAVHKGSCGGSEENAFLKYHAYVALCSASAFFMYSLALKASDLSGTTSCRITSRVMEIADKFEVYRLWPEGEWSDQAISGWLVRSKRFMKTGTFGDLNWETRAAVKISVKELSQFECADSLEERRHAAYATHLRLTARCKNWFTEGLIASRMGKYNGDLHNYFQAFHTLHEQGIEGPYGKQVLSVSPRIKPDPFAVRADVVREMGYSYTYRDIETQNNREGVLFCESQRLIVERAVRHDISKVADVQHNRPLVLRSFDQMFRDVVEEEMGFIIESHDSCERHAGCTSSYLHSPYDEEVKESSQNYCGCNLDLPRPRQWERSVVSIPS
jgi:hypothetical protein